MSFIYTQYFDHNKIYNLLSSMIAKRIGNGKTVCDPTLTRGFINMVAIFYMQVGYEHDVYLLHLSPHLSLTVYLMVEEPNA
jgi:hypothetical protein